MPFSSYSNLSVSINKNIYISTKNVSYKFGPKNLLQGSPLQKRVGKHWWEKAQEHLHYSGKCGLIMGILLALRFFIFQYGLVYSVISIINKTKSFLIYTLSSFFFCICLWIWCTYYVYKQVAELILTIFQWAYRFFCFMDCDPFNIVINVEFHAEFSICLSNFFFFFLLFPFESYFNSMSELKIHHHSL